MEHIIIQLYVPAIGENFDLKIPLSMMILDLVKLLGQAVETLSNGRYCVCRDIAKMHLQLQNI